MKKYIGIITAFFVIAIYSCKEDELELGAPPSFSDVTFTAVTSPTSDNVITFTANNPSVIAVWDFGNGTTGKGTTVTTSYPRKGVYTVILTVFADGGSLASQADITIANDDFSLLSDTLFTLLTGGVNNPNGKIWVIDSTNMGHMGVGPNPPSALGFIPEWWSAAPNDKAATGLYNDEYVFYLDGSRFDMLNKGDIYVHTDHESNFPGAFQNKGDFTAPFPEQLNENWLLTFDAGSDTTITISGSAFMGMNTGVQTYRILSITEDVMFLRYLHAGNDGLSWYLRLIRKGYDPGSGGGGGGGGTAGETLPIDFENDPSSFEGFGGSTADVIDNPDARGINTSSKVLETVHGNETWAGVSVELANKLDFSVDSFLVVKVWAPTPGVLRMKVEDKNDANTFVEADINVPVSFTWIERRINFGEIAASGTYDKVVLFPGWDVSNAGTFYLDDIEQQ